jgi:hypothetical protein
MYGGLARQREETTDEPQGWTREGTRWKSQTQSQWGFPFPGRLRHLGYYEEFIFIESRDIDFAIIIKIRTRRFRISVHVGHNDCRGLNSSLARGEGGLCGFMKDFIEPDTGTHLPIRSLLERSRTGFSRLFERLSL